jgi:hypothetical protein
MATSLSYESLVYLALKGVLQGPDVHIRQESKVRKLIEKNRNHTDIKHLIQEYSLESLCQTTKALLRDRIFESTLKAKVRFPEVFEVSPNQTAERAISESEAARNEDAALQSVTEGRPDVSEIIEDKAPVADQDESNTSLYPVYLPFSIQHRLLSRVQTILETACYTFASKRLPNILEREGWSCPESVELNRWPKILLAHREEFNQSSVDEIGKPLPDLLNSIAQLRHTAVHRLRLTANRTLQFVVDAEALVKLLRDDVTLDVVASIRRHVQTCIGEIERNKDLLELSMATTKAQFAAKRAELERQEREALENTVNEDKEYTILAGRSLEQALDAPDPAGGGYGKASSEEELSSETEIDEHGGYELVMDEKHAG